MYFQQILLNIRRYFNQAGLWWVYLQTLIVHMIRTAQIPFIQSRAATPLLIMTAVIMCIGIFLPMGPLASYLKLQALPLSYFFIFTCNFRCLYVCYSMGKENLYPPLWLAIKQ